MAGVELFCYLLGLMPRGRYQLTAISKKRRVIYASDYPENLATLGTVFASEGSFVITMYDTISRLKVDWISFAKNHNLRTRHLDASAEKLQQQRGRGKDNA